MTNPHTEKGSGVCQIQHIESCLTLGEVITNYREQLDVMNTLSDVTYDLIDDVVAKTYGPYMDMLVSWVSPATNYEEAMQALRLAAEEADAYNGSYLVEPMVKTALQFLDKKH